MLKKPYHVVNHHFFSDLAVFIIETRTLFFIYENVFPAQAEYSYFSADFRLKIFLYYS